MQKAYFIHESSFADEGCSIGEGTKIWHFSHIMKGCVIGKNCSIGQNVVISTGAVLGDKVKIQNNVSVCGGITCEDGVFLGPSCVFADTAAHRALAVDKTKCSVVRIKQGASIGANATIVCGHDIGKYAFIGAGAVVSKNVPDYALVYGVPAKQHGWVCECGNKLIFEKDKAVCASCGKRYEKNEHSVSRS